LIRASILDNGARRQADTLAYGERRVLELIAANAPLEKTLLAVVRLIEQLHPGVGAAIKLLDTDAGKLNLAAACGLSAALSDSLAQLPVGRSSSSCGVAASLGRQVVVRDIASDPLCFELAGVAAANGVHACCSTPIITAGDRVHGTLALYFDAVRGPNTEELDLVTRLTQLAGIAIRRKQDETALRDSEARFRSLFDNVVDGVYQAAPGGELLSANPALMQMFGLDAEGPDALQRRVIPNPGVGILVGELAGDGLEERLRKALDELEQYVAHESVADRHVAAALKKLAAFHVSHKFDLRVAAQKIVRLLDDFGSLAALLADGNQPHPGLVCSDHALRIQAGHDGVFI
jgi:hypothetical protein